MHSISFSHLKSFDDDYSLSSSSNHSSSNNKSKRKLQLSRATIRRSHLADDESDFSDDEYRASKRHKDYHSTLNELHPTQETYYPSNKNERFNHHQMTKLPNENLRLRHFRDCLVDQEDQEFFNSINSYLDSYRERLFRYRTYMKIECLS